jgi:maleamate amidohydrolase
MESHQHEIDFFVQRGFGQNIGFGQKPAILVIDMMNAFTNTKLPLGVNQDAEILSICRLLATARNKNIPIYFTITCYNDKDFSDAGVWFLKMKGLSSLVANTEETNLDNRLNRYTTEPIIIKKYASAYFGTDLFTRLNYKRIDTVVIVGCTTSGCVRATAVDAIQLGFRPVVVEDAVGDRSENAHKQSLFDLQAKYADVVSLDKVISYLEGIETI